MRSEVFTVAKAGTVDGGLLNLQEAGWSYFWTKAFPASVRGVLAGVVVYDEDETDPNIAVSFRATLSNGDSIDFISALLTGPASGEPRKACFVVPLDLTVAEAAVLKIELLKEGETPIAEAILDVRLGSG
jgi:hypothetical protein